MTWKLRTPPNGPGKIVFTLASGRTVTIETDAEGRFEAPAEPFPFAIFAHLDAPPRAPWWRRIFR